MTGCSRWTHELSRHGCVRSFGSSAIVCYWVRGGELHWGLQFTGCSAGSRRQSEHLWLDRVPANDNSLSTQLWTIQRLLALLPVWIVIWWLKHRLHVEYHLRLCFVFPCLGLVSNYSRVVTLSSRFDSVLQTIAFVEVFMFLFTYLL